jgi:alcohol dehydrogenase
MFTVDNYTPTRVVFGAGRLNELATMSLPGRKAMIFVTADGLMQKIGLLPKVIALLTQNNVEATIYDKITPNPQKKQVMEAVAIAKNKGCDFFIGLGGGSSIDTAKAASIMMVNEGDLWDYAYTGTGGRKSIKDALPVMTISTTCGTGTETDPYCVITNEETSEKLDFAADAIFPRISIIDPELMLTLPKALSMYQGFDSLFHLSECYITNNHKNRLVDVYAAEGIRTVSKWLPEVYEDGRNLEARVNMSYAANILAGYTQSLINCTSHHIIAQTLGGLFPNVAHGLSLVFIAEAYYKKVYHNFPQLFDELGQFMGVEPDPEHPGSGFVQGLIHLLERTNMRYLAMSEYGITRDDLVRIADMTVNNTGIADMDHYPDVLTVADIQKILEDSYR